MGNEENTDRRDSPSQTQDWSGHESNPFVAFRRYADEQVSTLLQSITGLPSMVTAPHSGHWDLLLNDPGYGSRLSHQRTGDGSNRTYTEDRDNAGGYRGNRVGDDAHDYGTPSRPHWPDTNDHRHSLSLSKWCDGPSDFFGLDSFFDRFWLEDRFFPFAPHLLHPGHSHFLSDLFEDANSPTWPIAYIMFSPYSPLSLERQAQYRSHREKGIFSSIMSSLHLKSDRDPSEPQWREAFEDLLRLENGKPMLAHDTPAKSETGTEWLQALVKRGSLGDRWKFVPGSEGQPWSGITFSGPVHPEQERYKDLPENEKESADTELDLYERFLQDIEDREREFFRGASESPLLRLLLEERKQQQEELEKYRSSVPRIADERSRDSQGVDIGPGSDRNTEPNSETLKDSSTEETRPSKAVLEPAQPRVISTMTRTERVRLADGSVQTKIVKTKRFTDGREESDESVEVSHPQEGSKSDSEKSQHGWFWKD